jgi:hypothetical protein
MPRKRFRTDAVYSTVTPRTLQEKKNFSKMRCRQLLRSRDEAVKLAAFYLLFGEKVYLKESEVGEYLSRGVNVQYE